MLLCTAGAGVSTDYHLPFASPRQQRCPQAAPSAPPSPPPTPAPPPPASPPPRRPGSHHPRPLPPRRPGSHHQRPLPQHNPRPQQQQQQQPWQGARCPALPRQCPQARRRQGHWCRPALLHLLWQLLHPRARGGAPRRCGRSCPLLRPCRRRRPSLAARGHPGRRTPHSQRHQQQHQ